MYFIVAPSLLGIAHRILLIVAVVVEGGLSTLKHFNFSIDDLATVGVVPLIWSGHLAKERSFCFLLW
jgi:hypothetical protein